MSQEVQPHVDRWYEHIRHLVDEIGPRGSTTDAERRGSEYCKRVLDELGLDARLESFRSATSIYHPHVLGAVFLLTAFAVYPWGGRATAVVAVILTVVALVNEVLELGFRDNLFRRLIPKGDSQNAIAVAEPSGEPQRDIVLIGHVDSHRSPIIFSSEGWLRFYGAFIGVAFALFIAQGVLYTIGVFLQASWVWPATIPSAVCALVLFAICVQADLTPFSPGANDNATAAGLVLALGHHLRDEPAEHSRVWLVCSGCEEVQHYGAIDFFRRHGHELNDPVAVVFESLGCDGPAWLTREGIIVPFRASKPLVALAERLSAEHPEWKGYATKIFGGNTEMADALRAGIPAVTICGITATGRLPYWHQPADTMDIIDREVLGRAYAFTWAYLRALDGRAEAS